MKLVQSQMSMMPGNVGHLGCFSVFFRYKQRKHLKLNGEAISPRSFHSDLSPKPQIPIKSETPKSVITGSVLISSTGHLKF